MPIVQGATNAFRAGLPTGSYKLLTDTLKIALYTSAATLNADTAVYTTINEVVGTGYTAGGLVLAPSGVLTLNNIAYMTFSDAVWTGSLTARGALIYDETNSNATVCVLDFGADKTSVSAFTVQFPANGPTSSIIRIA